MRGPDRRRGGFDGRGSRIRGRKNLKILHALSLVPQSVTGNKGRKGEGVMTASLQKGRGKERDSRRRKL